MTDEALQKQFQTQVRRPASRVACPAPERLLAGAEAGGAEAVRLEVLDHVATCLDCRAEYEVARTLMLAAMAPTARRRWLPYAVAASAVLAAGLLATWQSRGTTAPVLRGDPGAMALWGAEINDSAIQFAWRPAADSRRYTLEVITDVGDVVFSTQTSDTVIVVPSTSLRSGALTWSVLAEREDGTGQRSVVGLLTLP